MTGVEASAYHVSSTGSDAYPGTREQPFATLLAAQAAVWRALLPWLPPPNGAALAVRRLRQLERSFAGSTFFEDDAARARLLALLAAARARWARLTWEEIQRDN